MTRGFKPFNMGRGYVFPLLLLLSICTLSVAEANLDSRGVLGFLRRLERRAEKKTSWFYRFFGREQEESDFNKAQRCDYDNPNTIQFCNPHVVNPRYASNHNPNLPQVKDSEGSNSSSTAAVPSKCLEDPDDPDCRELLQDGSTFNGCLLYTSPSPRD